MKKIRLYLPNVLLTFLLVFALLGTECVLFAKYVVLNADTFRTVAEEQDLKTKAYATLEKEFTSNANTTGIPAEVFLDPVDTDALHQGILDSVSQAFDYLNGKSSDYAFTMDFTELENAVNTFFSDYAEENGYEKDEAYDEKVTSTISSAESRILFVADTFKLSTIYRNGWLEKAKKYIGYLNPAAMGMIAVTAALLVLLIVCNRKQTAHLAYWLGLASAIAGLLLLLPCIYLTATDYFTAFVMSDPQIFAAVVGFLQLLTGRAMLMAGITAGIGILLLVLFGILRHKAASDPQQSSPDDGN